MINDSTPLVEVSRLNNTDSVTSSGHSHVSNLPDEVSSDVILQDCVTFALITLATCNYYDYDLMAQSQLF